jgi:hypothetical protein
MASTRHVTLTAATAKTVTSDRDHNEIGILHKGNVADPVYVTDAATATVKGDNTYTVLAGQHRFIPRLMSKGMPTTVSVISTGAVELEVEFP